MDEIIDYEIVWNYQNICRTCLSETNELVSIFINSKSQNKTYAEIIMSCTSLQILETDEISLKICSICINQIEQSHSFYKKCQEADLILQFSHKFYSKSQNDSNNLKNNIEQSNIVNDLISTIDPTNQLINDQTKCVVFDKGNEDECKKTTTEFDLASLPTCILISITDQTNELTNNDVNSEDFNGGIEDESIESGNDLSASNFDCASVSSNISTKDQIEQNLENKSTCAVDKNIEHKIVQCKFCFKSYISELSLERHMEIHSGRTYECNECSLQLSSSSNLRRHKKIHLDGKVFVCDICNLNFPSVQWLNIHQVMHIKKPEYICNECGLILLTSRSFKDHKPTHDKSLKNKCKICGVVLNKKSLKRHMLLHNTNKFPGRLTNKEVNSEDFTEGLKDELNKSDNGLFASKVDGATVSSDISIKEGSQIEQNLENNVASGLNKRDENKIVQCKFCLKLYISELSLEKHLETHSKQTHECNECGLKYARYLSLNQHKRLHLDGQVFACNICNLNFLTAQHLNIHKVMHQNKPKYICNECGQILCTRGGLYDHKSVHDDTLKRKCKICGLRLRKNNLARHMHQHNASKPYNCDTCGRGFIQKALLIQHKMICTEESENGKTFHMCSICLRTFKNQHGLVHHSQRKHPLVPKENSNTKYNCTKCQRTFRFEYNFIRHMCSNARTLPTLCKICNKKFETYSKLLEHRKSEHQAVPVNLYQCEICGKGISTENGLARHMLVHNGVKPYKCSFCEKTFRQVAHKYSHELLHTGGKPYSCVHCNKSFRHQTTLIEHNRQHTGETPYKCHVCNKGFYRTGNLKKHLLTH